jgi:hypothetical protein
MVSAGGDRAINRYALPFGSAHENSGCRPRPIGAHRGDDLAARDPQVDAIERLGGAVSLERPVQR